MIRLLRRPFCNFCVLVVVVLATLGMSNGLKADDSKTDGPISVEVSISSSTITGEEPFFLSYKINNTGENDE